MKYIRTKDGIYTLITKDEPIYELNGKKYYCVEEQISSFSEDNVIKQADTVEELIMPGDLVEIGGYVMEVAHAFESEYKTIGIARPKECDDTRIYSYDIDNVRRLYIPNGNDYKLIAIHHNRRFDDLETIEEKGEWELL